MRWIHPGLVLVLALAATACDDATGPAEGRAGVRVLIHGNDERAAGPVTSAAPAGSGSGSEVQGRIEVRARVFVESTAGEWVELTRGATRRTVDASGAAAAEVLASAEIPSGSYRRARVEFESVRAEGVIGVHIGLDGSGGVVRVETGGDGTVTVEREVEMRTETGSTTEIRVDLNADQWLSGAGGDGGTVSEAEFRAAVDLSIR